MRWYEDVDDHEKDDPHHHHDDDYGDNNDVKIWTISKVIESVAILYIEWSK